MDPSEIISEHANGQPEVMRTRWRFIIFGIVGILLMLSMMMGLLTIRLLNHNIEEVEADYTAETFPAKVSSLCPGDTVEVSFSVDVYNAPAVFHVIEGVWSLDRNWMEILGRNNRIFLYRDTGRFEGVARYTLPETIPPGKYEYRRAAEQRFSGSIMFYTPFEVKSSGDCPSPVPASP